MKVDYVELKKRMMHTDIEELEAKLKSGYYDDKAQAIVEEVLVHKRANHPQEVVEKIVSKRTRRIAFLVTVGLVFGLYLVLRAVLKYLSSNP